MGVKLSKLMMRQYKDGVYRMSRATVAKHVARLEAMLQQAAEDAFVSEVVQTEMLSLELEANPWIGAKQYKEDWIETWLCALQEEVARKEIQ